jgi:flagellar hook assembly protein FlgD
MVSSLTEAIPLPETFSLDRAYPNPFNPTTTLSFALPVDAAVSLSIYNMQGREVSTLIDANMDAGYHSITWNADSYSSGVYFVKMVAGEFVNTQKLMLVK